MAELVNNFSWSFSAAADFEECRRRRYWSKYAMWNGWNKRSSALRQAAYRLNKMESRHSLKGHAVEKAIMWVLAQHQQGATVTADQAYREIVRPYLNTAWKQSRNKEWRHDPKRYSCLHEHYYPKLQRVDEKTWIADIAEQIKLCIVNFVEFVLPRLADVRPDEEVHVATPEKGGDPESFLFEDIKIYAIPDYVYTREGEWFIHDWKSGKPSPRHDDQLALYGLWAHLKHGVPIEKVRVFIEYLQHRRVGGRALTPEDMEQVKARIRESVSEMVEYLDAGGVKGNRPAPREEWDLSPTRDPCRRCKFYELCEAEFDPEDRLY